MTQTQYCTRHPKNETNIRCGRCEEAICPDCLVHSPVGMRCPDCARVNRVPTYDVTLPYLLRGITAGLAAALLLGVVFYFAAQALFNIVLFSGIPMLNIIFPIVHVVVTAAIGLAIGEAVSLATNRKRGMRLKIVSAACVFVASIPLTIAFPAAFSTMYLFIGLALATWLSIRPF